VGIHPLAVVHPSAQLGSDCEIGPFAIVEENTVMGDRCSIASHAVVKRGTTLGSDNLVGEHSVLGGLAQHVQAKTYVGRVRIGSGNVFREYITVHRPLHDEAQTVIGDNNFFMVNAHVAHDCVVGNSVILANNSMLGGHVTVEDRAFVSGGVAVHQFCRIGRQCMVGGTARIIKDVPPYVTIDGASNFVVGLNTIGLRRSGMTSADLLQLKQAYRVIYRSCLSWRDVLTALAEKFTTGPAANFLPFLQGTKRGIIAERRLPPGATLKLASAEEGEEGEGGERKSRVG
jgi:UDP-N-acetylglucosamine acyltransferase